MTTIKVADIDIVYLSYDEPNSESNWSHLQTICPRAQRVHGVKGSDAAHKACAEITTGTHMITVDGICFSITPALDGALLYCAHI